MRAAFGGPPNEHVLVTHCVTDVRRLRRRARVTQCVAIISPQESGTVCSQHAELFKKKRENFESEFDHEDRVFNPTKSVCLSSRFSIDLNFCKKVELKALNHNYWWPIYGAKVVCCAQTIDPGI